MGDMLNIQGTARNSKENRSNSSWCSSVVLRVTLNRRVHVSEDFYIERFFQENPHQHGYGCISGTRIHGSQIRTFLFLFVFILKLSICIVEKIRKILSIFRFLYFLSRYLTIKRIRSSKVRVFLFVKGIRFIFILIIMRILLFQRFAIYSFVYFCCTGYGRYVYGCLNG